MKVSEPIKVWMKVCPLYGEGVRNVAEKYIEYAPEELIEWVDDWLAADVFIEHTIGTPGRQNLVHPDESKWSAEVSARLEMMKLGVVKGAYVHHCSIVQDDFYFETFRDSIICTGFLDAVEIMTKDVIPSCGAHKIMQEKWFRVPWGVSPEDFLLPMRKRGEEPKYLIYTWGCSANPEDECLLSIYEAVKKVGGKMLHSGYDYKFDDGKHYVYLPPAKTRKEIAQRYNLCKFANACRREDGFELANLESKLANTHPIALNFASYRYFFSDLSILIDPNNIEQDLIEVFQKPYREVSMQEKCTVIESFNWKDSVAPFWSRILENCHAE